MAIPSTSTVELSLRAAIDAAPFGLLMTGPEGRVVLANQQIEAMFGYARGELLGHPVELLVPEHLRAGHVAKRADFLRDPRVRALGSRHELVGLRKNGTSIPLEIGLTPVVTGEGMFVLSTIVDVSARKRAEERFRVAVESSPNGMLMIDREGRIVLVNREIERMFGYARADMVGQFVEMLVPERFRASHPRERGHFFAHPQSRSMGAGRDLHGVRKDGVEIPLEIGLNPIVTEEGLFVLGSVVDISARRRAEDDHYRLEEQFRQAQKVEAIGRLASGIAHDFNNLLMGILGCAEMARTELAPDHPVRSIVDDICGAAQRGASLTKDLLGFSRKDPVEVGPADLNAVVRVAERILRQVIGEDVRLVVDLCPSGAVILGNPTHLEQALLNMAVNARDAMPRGGTLRITTCDVTLVDPLTTRTRELPPGDYVQLLVEDSGIGMNDDTVQRLFEPFFTTKEVGRGTGLGLYTVYSIVDQLEGGLVVESEVGRGTRFSILFPRLSGPSIEPEVLLPAPTARSPRGGGAHILLVEDELLIRSTLRQWLLGLGYRVTTAADGAGALAAARTAEAPIDLLLSDMVLPDTSGADLAAVLQREDTALRVLFMSAYPSELLVQQGRIAPGTSTLEKPFDVQTLVRAIEEMLAPMPATRSTPKP